MTWIPIGNLRGPAGDDGPAGLDGREIALRTAAGFVQWQYDGDPGWTNLIALTDLTGPSGADGTDGTNGADGADGKSVELRVSGGYVQWRQTDGAWGNLIALTAITGPAGEDGAPGTPGADGADGEDGAPGAGVPTGGTVGQVLSKTGTEDYATGWADPAGGGGGSDADTAGYVTDEGSLTREALDALTARRDTTITAAQGSGSVDLSPGYVIVAVSYSTACRLRLYRTAAGRDADTGRPVTTPYPGGRGRVYEYVAEGAETDVEGAVLGAADGTTVYYRVDGGPSDITITWYPTERA